MIERTIACLLAVALALSGCVAGTTGTPPPAAVQAPLPTNEALVARARALELDTPYVPPPGDRLEHETAAFAKIMCSAVFITGLDPEFAAENVGYFTSPYASRANVGKPAIDRARRAVHVTMPNGVTRTAKVAGSQGCVALRRGETDVHFVPETVGPNLPDASSQPWPMGDAAAAEPWPAELDRTAVSAALDAAFAPAGEMTAAFVAVWKGRIIAERYAPGITMRTPLESWSMGKSTTATLMALLIRQGVYGLTQPAPIPEWQTPGDPRAAIRIADILQMSSGLRSKAPQDPDYDPKGPYPDHLYLYTAAEDVFRFAATRPLQWPPGQVGRYHNTDPVLINYLIRLAVEKRGESYLAFPQRALFDRLGIRSAVIETDAFGNFLTQGNDYMSARDWARLGLLYLQDGVWQGARLLPEGFVRFVSSVAPAWRADGRPIYGGFFWINGDRAFPIPDDAYYMAGAGGQNVFIIPSHDLVVVRMGHYKGNTIGTQGIKNALAKLVAAVPRHVPATR
ncbi:MAG: serine hydrolase [Acidobacteria bacterium]|nr:serine hydrolase [Acidobacteriota bacterium]